MNRSTPRMKARRGGFTLIELLVVVIVLAILMALLLPAINSAMKTARQAAVQSEINQIAAALENFKSKYGDYPPSRILLVENGDYSSVTSNASLSASGIVSTGPTDPTSSGTGDITVGQLARRSVAALRKFFPQLQLNTGSTSGHAPNITATYWYDFNGDGTGGGQDGNATQAYVLHGHECLVFFLGGVPLHDPTTGTYQPTGFGKDPKNPFSNSIVGSNMYNANRLSPFYEFNPGRLFQDLANTSMNGSNPGIPAYYDTLNTGPPAYPLTGEGPVNFVAYFSAYGNGNYDPNDVNIYEIDPDYTSGTGASPLMLQFAVTYPLSGVSGTPALAPSGAPNPYTASLTGPPATGTFSGTVTYQKPQTFQIISAGVDGLYGVGGQFVPQTQSATQPLPLDKLHLLNSNGGSVRQREGDNLTNFKSGTLQ